jgi:hypothetical protein
MATSGKGRRAKKIGRSKTGTKKQPKKYTGVAAAGAGPVTLAEAKALAQAKQPKLATRAARKGVAPPASPAAVGAERERLEKERHDEFTRRVQEYKATMEIMKKRGARRPRPKKAAKPKGEEPASEDESFEPLQIFAEGDSWFDYPIPFFGGGIIPRLENPARRSDLESCESGRRGPLYAWRRGAHPSHRPPDERVPGRRTMGRAAVLGWR